MCQFTVYERAKLFFKIWGPSVKTTYNHGYRLTDSEGRSLLLYGHKHLGLASSQKEKQ